MSKNRYGPFSNRPYHQKEQHNVKLHICKCKITTDTCSEGTGENLGGPSEAGEIH